MNVITNCRDIVSPAENQISCQAPTIRLFADTPLQYYGGGEIVIINLSNYLFLKNLKVEILQDLVSRENRISLESIKKLISGEIILVPFEKRHIPRFLYQKMPSIEEFEKAKVNLVFLYRIPSKRYLKKLKKSGSRIIFCLHGITTVINSSSIKFKFFKTYLNFTLKNFSKFLRSESKFVAQVLSKSMEKVLLLYGADSDHIFRITNGVDFTRYSVGKNNEQFTVVFIGRLQNAQKGIDRLVNVINKLPDDIKIVIIGSGPDSDLLKFKPGTNVECLGFVTEDDKKRNLEAANLLIMTSNLDPFPAVLLEGLASGLPIVSTPIEGATEILNQDKVFGTLSTFEALKISIDIVKYFEEWKMDKELYYQNKMRRRETAMLYYNQFYMVNKYYQMIAKFF